MLVVLNLVWHDIAILHINFVLVALCLWTILIAEIAGCGVMEIPIHSVTSYTFHEEFVVSFLDWGGGGWGVGGIHVSGLFLHR